MMQNYLWTRCLSFILKHHLVTVFSLSYIHYAPGHTILLSEGTNSYKFFSEEVGGHCWHRCAPTDKRGRIQTSVVTVATIPVNNNEKNNIRPEDLRWDTFCSGGPGGQHQNKTQSGVRVVHKPTGIQVVCTSERSQIQNKKYAMDLLLNKLDKNASSYYNKKVKEARFLHGSGERADKIRTYKVERDLVTDHNSNKKATLSRLYKGDWSEIK